MTKKRNSTRILEYISDLSEEQKKRRKLIVGGIGLLALVLLLTGIYIYYQATWKNEFQQQALFGEQQDLPQTIVTARDEYQSTHEELRHRLQHFPETDRLKIARKKELVRKFAALPPARRKSLTEKKSLAWRIRDGFTKFQPYVDRMMEEPLHPPGLNFEGGLNMGTPDPREHVRMTNLLLYRGFSWLYMGYRKKAMKANRRMYEIAFNQTQIPLMEHYRLGLTLYKKALYLSELIANSPGVTDKELQRISSWVKPGDLRDHLQLVMRGQFALFLHSIREGPTDVPPKQLGSLAGQYTFRTALRWDVGARYARALRLTYRTLDEPYYKARERFYNPLTEESNAESGFFTSYVPDLELIKRRERLISRAKLLRIGIQFKRKNAKKDQEIKPWNLLKSTTDPLTGDPYNWSWENKTLLLYTGEEEQAVKPNLRSENLAIRIKEEK